MHFTHLLHPSSRQHRHADAPSICRPFLIVSFEPPLGFHDVLNGLCFQLAWIAPMSKGRCDLDGPPLLEMRLEKRRQALLGSNLPRDTQDSDALTPVRQGRVRSSAARRRGSLHFFPVLSWDIGVMPQKIHRSMTTYPNGVSSFAAVAGQVARNFVSCINWQSLGGSSVSCELPG